MKLLKIIDHLAGMILLLLYYLATPPLVGLRYAIPSEGNYLIVNKTLIEAAALALLLLFPTSKTIGLDRLIFAERERNKNESAG